MAEKIYDKNQIFSATPVPPNGVLVRALAKNSFAIASSHCPVVLELENPVKKPESSSVHSDDTGGGREEEESRHHHHQNHQQDQHTQQKEMRIVENGVDQENCSMSLAKLHARIEKTEFQPLLESILHLPQSSQETFLTLLCGALSFESLLHIKSCTEKLIKRDFISLLPPEIVGRILSFVDVKTQGRMALVCKKWRNAMAPIWKTACQRSGIHVTSDHADYWIDRYRRAKWRLKSWSEDPSLSVVPVASSFPGDQDTLCFIPASGYGSSPFGGFIAASISPGMVVFYPESEAAGATYFLRTGPAISPTVLNVFGELAILGFGNGSIQQWNWKQNVLLGEFQNVSLTPVTSLDYSENWDLIAVGSEDSSVNVWRASTCELVSSFCDTSNGTPGGAVRKLRFVDRTLYSSVIDTSQGQWSRGEDHILTYKLFLAALYEVHSISFMFGSKRRSFCNFVVWDIEPYSGNVLSDIYIRDSGWDHEGVKDSLEIIQDTGTVVYLTSYDFGQNTFVPDTDEVTLTIHEFDPIGEEEFLSSVTYYPLSPLGSVASDEDIPGIREWQILGIGRRFMALGVWELNRNDLAASTVSALLVYEQVSEGEQTKWVRTLALTPAGLIPEYGIGQSVESMVFGSMVLGHKSWLDGFDGDNDSGLLFAGAYWDFLQGGWRVKCFSWREPGQGPFGYTNPHPLPLEGDMQ